MRQCVLALLILTLVAVFGAPVVLAEGTLDLRLLNVAADLNPLVDAPITLWKVSRGVREVAAGGTTDEAGSLRLMGLETGADVFYYSTATIGGESFVSDVVSFVHDEPLLSADVWAYPVVDIAQIEESQAHWILDVQPGRVHAQEVHVLAFPEGKTYVSLDGEGTGFTLPLPSGATNVRSEDAFAACCARRNGDRLEYLLPLLPGMRQYVYTYDLAATESYTLAVTIEHSVQKWGLLIADTGVGVGVSGMIEQPAVEMAGRRYLHYSATDLKSGHEVQVQLDGIPTPLATAASAAQPVTGISWSLVLTMGAGTLAIVALLAYPLLQRDKGATP